MRRRRRDICVKGERRRAYEIAASDRFIDIRAYALTLCLAGSMNVLTAVSMRLETKFLRLRTPVTIGSRFGDWEACWLGGWTRDRLSYLVMTVLLPLPSKSHEKVQSKTSPAGNR